MLTIFLVTVVIVISAGYKTYYNTWSETDEAKSLCFE